MLWRWQNFSATTRNCVLIIAPTSRAWTGRRRIIKTKVKKKVTVNGVEKEIEEIIETLRPGHLEVVYHLYSMELKHGPLVLRMRTDESHGPHAACRR